MDPAMVGMLVGALLGFVNFLVLRWLAAKMEKDVDKQKGQVVNKNEMARPVAMIWMLAPFEILVFAVVGYFIGPILLGQS